jgi:hypothetical protein
MVKHQAERVKKMIIAMNARNWREPIPTTDNSQLDKSRRLERLASMSGITSRSRVIPRGFDKKDQSIQTQTTNRDGNFHFPEPYKFTDVRVGDQPKSIAVSAKDRSQAERRKRLGAIRAANKNSRSIGGV